MSSSAPGFALKEWSVVCDLLASGAICLLPRKGGIREFGGPGVFELEHDDFFLFPTLEHEKLDRIKPEFLTASWRIAGAPAGTDRDTLKIEARARVGLVRRVPSREAFDRLEDLHPWLPSAIDMRFDYKPENPLYLVALRVFRLREPRVIPHRDSYRGCRSWVPLESGDLPEPEGEPVMTDAAFAAVLARVDAAFAQP